MFALAFVESDVVYLGSVRPEATQFFHSWFVSPAEQEGRGHQISSLFHNPGPSLDSHSKQK